MKNDEGESIDRAPNPMMILTMPVAQPVKPGDIKMLKMWSVKFNFITYFKMISLADSRYSASFIITQNFTNKFVNRNLSARTK
jgi:hypothetical protein